MSLLLQTLVVFLILGVYKICRSFWLFTSLHDHGESKGCGRLKLLPSSWLLPLGLDKLLKSLAAEKDRKFPVLRFDDHELYGDTYGQYAGGLFTILTRDPRNISSVLSKQSSKFGDASLRRMCFGPLLGDGIFTEDGRAWETSRRLLAPVLNKPHFPVLHTIETHVQDLFLAISRAHSGRDGPRVVDLRPLFFNFTLDTATELLLGVSTATLRHDFVSDSDNEGARFSAAFNTALLWLARREHFKSFGWLVQGPEFTRVCTTARSSLERLITDALATQESHGANNSSHSALHDIVTQTPNLAKARDEFLSLLFAARDTTASSLCWVFYALSREPRVFEKLQSEIFSALGDDAGSERRDVRAPEEAHLRRMHYLDAVFYETLRLFPPVPMNARMCSEDTTLPSGGGVEGEDQIFVPKGTLVAFSTYGTQRSRKYWGEGAGTFKPERWLGDDGTTTNKAKESTRDWSFHPFIGGPRKCLGEKFALKIIKYTTCRFVQHYSSIEAIGPAKIGRENWQNDIRYHIGLTMALDEECKVRWYLTS